MISYISYLIQKYQRRTKPVHLNLGWQCLQYVQIHHQEHLTSASVASALGIPSKKVLHLIKTLTGHTFKQVLNQVRVRNATALLQFDELSVNQIARICGYHSQSNFYKQFEVIHGISPTQYRSSILAQTCHFSSTDTWLISSIILENCTKPFTMKDLVSLIHISDKRIERLLEESFQTTFAKLRNQFRLQISRTLLATFNFSVQKIADLVGFTNANTFIRNFKNTYGITPGEYRQQKITHH